MMYVVKRDGTKEVFFPEKISKSISKAAIDTCLLSKSELIILSDAVKYSVLEELRRRIECEAINPNGIPTSFIYTLILKYFEENSHNDVMNILHDHFVEFRKNRDTQRDLQSNLMKSIQKIGVETDRDNANVGNNFSSKLLRIASESNKRYNLLSMPTDIRERHENGDIYYHDLDSYNLTTNCLHIPTGEVLKRGFNTGYGTIRSPKRIGSASELSCILLQSTQNDMFGGQSHPNFDNDLSIFVEFTRKELYKEYYTGGVCVTEEFVEKKVEEEVHQAMQAVVYNLNTMHSRAGSQVPFSSVNMGLPENEDSALVCKVFLEEYEKGLGKGEQPIFPNIIFRVKDGVNRCPKDPYYYLFKLACRVASKRMNPTFMNMDADFNKKYYDQGVIPATMGCRTYICSNINGDPGVEGRGNIAPVTINLPRLGILAHGDIEKFFDLLDIRLSWSVDSLLHRYGILKKLRVKDLPFVAGQGLMKGSENLSPEDSIEPILKQGSWAIGFIGLAETLTALTGEHQGQSHVASQLGLDIISYIRNFTDKVSKQHSLNFSCYATPAEGLSGKFIIQDKERFGIVPGVTDKDYYTNGYHIPVGFPVSIVDKLKIEAPYHKLCNGGHITYIELDYYPDEETVESIIKYAYEKTNISYIGINFHIRYCKDCGTYLIPSEQGCPKCGSHNIQGVSRVTGYLSLDERFGIGKSAEREDRSSHTNPHRKFYTSQESDENHVEKGMNINE